MRTVSFLAVAAAQLGILAQQSLPPSTPVSVAGAWRAQSSSPDLPWTVVFRISGNSLLGAVSSCSSVGPAEIFEGTIDGTDISFKCRSGDGARTLTMSGKLGGERIDFRWEKAVRAGGNDGRADPMFGEASLREVTAIRLAVPPRALADLAAKARGPAAISVDRILKADEEPHNWLTYSGTVLGRRHSPLARLTPANVKNLEIAWLRQTSTDRPVNATPLVVDGVMYTVVPGEVLALDAGTGRVIWSFPYTLTPGARASGGGGRPNRGLAILGNRLFLGTIDAHLIAINALTGKPIWKTQVADFADPACGGRLCYVITHASLVVKNSVIVGVGGGEGPIRGFIAAFDADSGKEVWRFHAVPASGEPGSETWAGDSWKTGGVGVWQIGAYDAALNLTYWGTGNPFPGLDGSTRAGDNLYSNSVVALDADTGALKWHYQFTPHDDQDWDSAQVPVLADIP